MTWNPQVGEIAHLIYTSSLSGEDKSERLVTVRRVTKTGYIHTALAGADGRFKRSERDPDVFLEARPKRDTVGSMGRTRLIQATPEAQARLTRHATPIRKTEHA